MYRILSSYDVVSLQETINIFMGRNPGYTMVGCVQAAVSKSGTSIYFCTMYKEDTVDCKQLELFDEVKNEEELI